jgi:hypothetical protein
MIETLSLESFWLLVATEKEMREAAEEQSQHYYDQSVHYYEQYLRYYERSRRYYEQIQLLEARLTEAELLLAAAVNRNGVN